MAMVETIRDDLEYFLRKHYRAGDLEVTEFEPIPEGHSGFTYFVTTRHDGKEQRYVMRLPPPGRAYRRTGRYSATRSHHGGA
jgi:hypothetical protein